jgi:isocitrate lyase
MGMSVLVHFGALNTNDRTRFILQIVSLAGVHSNALITTELSRAFKRDGMLAYVKLIQSREKDLDVETLVHQRWSGASYIDGILAALQPGCSSNQSMGKGSTENCKLIYVCSQPPHENCILAADAVIQIFE